MNVSPKQRFLENEKLAKQFLDVVDSEAFARATELAMLAFIQELDDTGGDNERYQQIVGATRFLSVLKALPEPSKPPAPRTNYNIQHDIK